MLKFGNGNDNAKLKKLGKRLGGKVVTFSLPAGFTCPGAKACFAFADKETGKVTDGKDMLFRCFAASGEAVYPNVRRARWHNFDALKEAAKVGGHNAMAALIVRSLHAVPGSKKIKAVRVHVSGDFFSRSYAEAWVIAANYFPGVNFYAYTKSVPFVAGLEFPSNFRVIYSEGGKHDADIPSTARTARVVLTDDEAEILNLEIDNDDSLALLGTDSFALKIHGTQPKKGKGA